MKRTELIKLAEWFNEVEALGLSSDILGFMWSNVLWDAIKNKHAGIDKEHTKRLVARGAKYVTANPAEEDILRQLSTLEQIEKTWRFLPLTKDLFLSIYSQAYGIPVNIIKWRDDAIVLENNFVTPVAPESIEKELPLLWRLLDKTNNLTKSDGISMQIKLAIEIFAKVIYIHPFPDGNGRTARLFINLLMRRWHLPYIAIPKVRNSPEWEAALREAMNGKTSLAQEHLESLLLITLQKINTLMIN